MARVEACVRDGVLTYRDGDTDHVLPVGGGAWEGWLEQPSTKVFRFDHGAAGFTARREPQRGRWYWYAYRRRGGRLRKAYLGRASDLTLDRLAAVGARLDEAVEGSVVAGDIESAAAGPPAGRERHNLPSEVSSFLGRQAEIAELRRALPGTRLLTLTGAGGVGKTRLALRLASDVLEDAADAVWLVELAALADPALVPQAVAQAVGTREQPGRPLLETLATALGVAPTLLVLDNCEHLVDACAHVAGHLLRASPTLHILATSREPLGVPGEVAWPVPPLGLPADDEHAGLKDRARSEAVQLFVVRAQAARPGFTLTEQNVLAVSEVCRRLDGIPLAIELAAARLRVLSPAELAARLDDRFRLLTGGSRTASPRQQTLRATVEWSYDLLTEVERRLFERLSVFAGGFTLDAVEAVCGDSNEERGTSNEARADAQLVAHRSSLVPRNDVLDLLTRLVDRSLVLAEQHGTEATRYRLLETLRAYGVNRLAERGDAEWARERHARWMTELAQRAERAFHGPSQGHWLRWAEREHDNATAALTWAVECGDVELAVSLAAALSWPWVLHQRWSEGLEWAERVLAMPQAVPTRERGMLLTGAIQFALFRGDLASNRPSGDLAAVRGRIEECLTIGEALNDDELILGAYGMSQLVREFGVDLEGAPEVTVEELNALARRIGHTWGECRGLEAMARRALRAGDLDTAGAHLTEAIRLARGAGDTWSLAMALHEIGDVERVRGAHPHAGVLYEESLTLFSELGLGARPSLVHNLGYVALAAGDRVGAATNFAQALNQFRRLGEARGMAECLIGFGALAAAKGRTADAARLFGAGEAALDALGIDLWPSNLPDYTRWLSRVRLGRAVASFDRTRAEGRALSLEQAVALALAGNDERRVRLPDSSFIIPRSSFSMRLTPREQEIAQLAAQGLTNRQIAATLVIAEKTAANHVQRVLEKLDLRSRTQLAARAAEFGLTPAGAQTHTTDATR